MGWHTMAVLQNRKCKKDLETLTELICFSAAAKHSLLVLICICPSSQRAEKQIPKTQAFCADIFSQLTTNVQFLCSAERQINLEVKKQISCFAHQLIRLSGRRPSNGWTDRQTGSLPTNLATFLFSNRLHSGTQPHHIMTDHEHNSRFRFETCLENVTG